MNEFNLEGIAEAAEAAELGGNNELLEQVSALQEKLDAALEENNAEKANFFRGELGKITEQMQSGEAGATGEISFGGTRHSPEYWYRKAGEEKAKHGESSRYRDFIRYAGEAEAEKIRNR